MTSDVYFCPPGWSDVPCTGHPVWVAPPFPGASTADPVVVLTQNRLDELLAEARQQGRDHGLRETLEAELAKQSGLPTLMRSSGYESGLGFALRALASADGPPEPGIDVERLQQGLELTGVTVHLPPDFGYVRNGAEAIAKVYLSADGDSPGDAE